MLLAIIPSKYVFFVPGESALIPLDIQFQSGSSFNHKNRAAITRDLVAGILTEKHDWK